MGHAEALARWLLGRRGWRIVYASPPAPKCVITFYPHTSNWDFVIGILARAAIGLPCHFVAKDTLFRWPTGGILRRMGGIPVNRREHTGFIAQLAREFSSRERFFVAIAPEGTRSRTERWKSGFYHLALAARVPLALAYIDYPRREIGIGAYLDLTGDAERDLAAIRGFYSDKIGRWPGKQGEIRLASTE